MKGKPSHLEEIEPRICPIEPLNWLAYPGSFTVLEISEKLIDVMWEKHL
jgi:hypothetical protein